IKPEGVMQTGAWAVVSLAVLAVACGQSPTALSSSRVALAVTELRTAAGLSQAVLAPRAGLSLSTGPDVEQMRDPVVLSTILAAANAFEVPVKRLFPRLPVQ